MTNMINRHKRAAAIMIVIVAAFVLLFQNTAESLAATAVGSTQTVKVQKDGLTKNFRANVAYSVATSEASVTLTCAAIRFESRSASSDYSNNVLTRNSIRNNFTALFYRITIFILMLCKNTISHTILDCTNYVLWDHFIVTASF